MDGEIVLDPDNYKCLWQVVLRPTNGHDGLGSDIGYGQGIDGAASNLQRRHNELDIGIQHVLTRTFGPRSWPAFGINGIPSSHFQHLLAPANSFCMWIGLIVFCLRNFHEWQMCAALRRPKSPWWTWRWYGVSRIYARRPWSPWPLSSGWRASIEYQLRLAFHPSTTTSAKKRTGLDDWWPV